MASRLARRSVISLCCVAAVGVWLSAAEAPVAGVITTVAGTGIEGFSGDSGVATSAQISTPGGLAIDSVGNVYVADITNNRVRRIAAGTGVITTVAGSGSTGDLAGGFAGDGGLATSARLWAPSALALDTAGNLYIADRRNHRIRKITAATGIITTVAGSGGASVNGGYGGDGGAATSALLALPGAVAVDASGHIYIADYGNNRVRRVDAVTGIITTVAGTGTAGYNGDGVSATAAQVNGPSGVAVDATGHLYIADAENYRVRRVHATTGLISTIAGTGQPGFSGEGGAGTTARVDSPGILALDGRGNLLLVDSSIHRVRSLSLSTGIIVTVAGNGSGGSTGDSGLATTASLLRPGAVAVDTSGNIYVSDSGNYRVRKVATPTTPVRVMSTLAGTGVEGFSGDGGAATSAQLTFPFGVAVDASGHVYIADAGNARVRRVDAGTGVITTIAGIGGRGSSGDGGLATAAAVEPSAIAVGPSGNLFIVDRVNRRVRKITAATGIITTVAGTGAEVQTPTGDGGPATAATFVFPARVAVDSSGHLYITDRSARNVRRVDATTGIITTVAGTGGVGFGGDGGPATAAQFTDPVGIAVDASGNLYITDVFGQRIRKVTAATGIITTIAGTGVAGFSGDGGASTAATINEPVDIAVAASGHVYFSDYSNRRVRMIDPGGTISTVAGSSTSVTRADPLAFGGDGAAATSALMRSPLGVAVDAQGSLFITDEIDHRVRKAGNPAQFSSHPADLSVTSGQAVSFTCAASGSPMYQWQISTDAGVTWVDLTNVSPYSGVGTATLSISSATAGLHGARYRCAATTLVATSFSTAAVLTVVTPTAPTIATHPAGATVTAGQNASFVVAATGVPTPTLRWQVSTDGGTTFSNLADGSPYSGVTTTTLTITAATTSLNGYRFRAVATNATGSATSTAAALAVRGNVSATPGALIFRATKAGASGAITSVTGPQTITVAFSGAASAWTASVAVPWLEITRGSGSGPAEFTVSIVNPLNVIGGSTELTATVTVAAPLAANASATVPVTLHVVLDGSPTASPIGQVDTPLQDTTGVQGAIAMTGWVVDDVGLQHVRIYRQCLPFDVPAACQDVLGSRLVFVGEAAIIPGARPDVEALYPLLPASRSAGWGFLILSNLLPDIPRERSTGGGVGTFQLTAIATDMEGHQQRLGRTTADSTPTTVTVANDTIAKPFGAIDTPGQGATVSGTLNNFGWALTPDSNTVADGTDILVPTTGSTINVFIDGAVVGTTTYNFCRGTVGNPVPSGTLCDDDVSSIFRVAGVYRNLDAARGPIALRTISTTALTNGLHTISWGVTDSASRSEGIGSRYFNVLNSAADSCSECAGRSAEVRSAGVRSAEVRSAEVRSAGVRGGEVFARTGFDLHAAYLPLESDVDGVPQVRIPEHGRVELLIPGVTEAAWIVNGEARSLPVGVGIDRELGVVTWVAGPGYLGTYRLRFARDDDQVMVDVTVAPALSESGGRAEGVRMHLDAVRVTGPALSERTVRVEGWALDPQASTGSGVGAVHIWATKKTSGVFLEDSETKKTPDVFFLGAADLGMARPDVAAAHGARFPHAGFVFTGALPSAGTWEVTAYVWVARTGRFEDARSLTVTVK